MVVSVRLVLLLIADEPVDSLLQPPPIGGGFLFSTPVREGSGKTRYGPIGLVHLSFGKHLVQSGEGLRGACEDDEAADGTVEAMHHAKEDGTWLVVLLLQIVLHQLRERLVASLVALDDLAALLIDDDNVVVLVDYFHLSDDFDALLAAELEAHLLQLELLYFAATREGELVDEEHVLGNLVAGNLAATELLHVFG